MATLADDKQSEFELPSHLFYNLIILFTGLLIFIFVPLFIMTPAQTKQFINNGRELQVLGDTFVLTACFYVLLGAVYWLLSLLKLKRAGATIVMFVLAWVTLSGFLLPLTTADGLVELRFAPTNSLNLRLVTVLSLFIGIFAVFKYAKVIHIYLAIFLTVSILPTIPRAFSQFEKQNGSENLVKLSTEKNFLLVGFDGLPGHVVKDVLMSTPEFADTFKDFTFYDNAVSSSPGTDASVLGIVYGNHDFTTWEDRAQVGWEDLYFNQDQVNFTTGFKYNTYNESGTKLSAGRYGKAEQRDQLFELYKNVLLRLTTKFGVSAMEYSDFLYFPDRKGKFYSTVEGFDHILNSLVVDSEKPAVFYTHFTFSHRPPSMDENCVNRRMDEGWLMSHQNREGLRAGAICSLKKYTELIERLKNLGVYEQTTIVLLSDHGKTVLFYDKPPYNLKINNGPEMGFDRYQPLLMIKPENQTLDAVTVSEKKVILDDLAQTSCNIFQTSEFCENRPGVNILDDGDVAPDDFYIHVVKDETSSWMVVDHKAVKISRQIPLVDAMMASGEIKLTEP